MNMLDSLRLEQALHMLGELLADRGFYYEVVAIGGGSLLLLEQIDRPTKDLDLVALIENEELISSEPLPEILLKTAEDVAKAMDIRKDWLNSGPTSLLQFGLPDGFKTRLHTKKFGGLTVHFASRFDQICFKLYASVDHGPLSKHFKDLRSLQPTIDELFTAKNWCLTQDASEPFAIELDKAFATLEKHCAKP